MPSEKQYLKNGDIVYCTGCYMKYENGVFSFRGEYGDIEDDIYFDGLPLEREEETPELFVERRID